LVREALWGWQRVERQTEAATAIIDDPDAVLSVVLATECRENQPVQAERSRRMMEEWAGGRVIESLRGRRDLDLAEGILIGLRRCGPNAAYRELLDAAKRQSVGLMAISSALVELASNQDPSPSHLEGPAHSAAYCEWRDLFDQRRRQTRVARTLSDRCGTRSACEETSNGAGE
jgi:hypothetical protein